mgnify:CR=1 FL=1
MTRSAAKVAVGGEERETVEYGIGGWGLGSVGGYARSVRIRHTGAMAKVVVSSTLGCGAGNDGNEISTDSYDSCVAVDISGVTVREASEAHALDGR